MSDLPPSLKIVLLGDSGVGKTTILARWMTGKYYQSLRPTVGTNHQRKIVTIKEKEVELFLWDTAGQEQFSSLIPMYSRNAAAVVIVCAVDDLNSFTNVKEWVELAKKSCEVSPPIILAVNKIDKKDDISFTSEKVNQTWGDELDGIFYVSALTGENIDTALMQAAQLGFNNSFTGTPNSSIIAANPDEGCC
jgi:small GTP-binding protein